MDESEAKQLSCVILRVPIGSIQDVPVESAPVQADAGGDLFDSAGSAAEVLRRTTSLINYLVCECNALGSC